MKSNSSYTDLDFKFSRSALEIMSKKRNRHGSITPKPYVGVMDPKDVKII